MSFKIVVLKNFEIFIGKHSCWSLFLIKLQGSETLLKETPTRYFAVNIEKLLRTAFLLERLW